MTLVQKISIERKVSGKMKDKSLWVVVGMVALLAVVGCSESIIDEPEPDTALQGDLAMMQGVWESVSTNACGMTVDGITIRLRYEDTPGSPMLRQNARIQRVDEQRKLLIINGGVGAWPYFYGIQDGEEHLEVEFFIQQNQEWKQLHLRRIQKKGS